VGPSTKSGLLAKRNVLVLPEIGILLVSYFNDKSVRNRKL